MEIETIYKLLNSKSAEDCRLGLHFLDRLDREEFDALVEKYSVKHDHTNTDYLIGLDNFSRPALKRVYFKGEKFFYLYYNEVELMIDFKRTGEYLMEKYPHIYTIEEL